MLTVTSDSKQVLAEIRKLIRAKMDTAQEILTLECKKHADKYTPMDTGNLRDVFQYTVNKSGAKDGWFYKVPYAWRQWRGVTETGKPFNYSKDANPNARSQWAIVGVIQNKDGIIRKVRDVMK